jgi:predicted transposase YdaD
VASTTKTPHDAIFKSVFEKPEHAAAELRHILPPELASALRWPSREYQLPDARL